ncbi:MAG: Uma2 family endonuclease [Okeania sp. SIO3B3]|nr:Uma2 family endonuclease [Okeania sp. SIO3B3]
MNTIETKLPTNTWVIATWNEFIQMAENPDYKKAKCYYHNDYIRIETMPIRPNHSRDNATILFAINLFCTIKSLAFNSLDNCSYRMAGIRECQPDISYYVGDRAKLAPKGTAITNLETTPPPDLIIEIADSTLADDVGRKRLLYEEIQVAEYWVVDVQKAEIIAFAIIDNNGSKRIKESLVLSGLSIAVLETALSRSRTEDQAQVRSWLLERFSELIKQKDN